MSNPSVVSSWDEAVSVVWIHGLGRGDREDLWIALYERNMGLHPADTSEPNSPNAIFICLQSFSKQTVYVNFETGFKRPNYAKPDHFFSLNAGNPMNNTSTAPGTANRTPAVYTPKNQWLIISLPVVPPVLGEPRKYNKSSWDSWGIGCVCFAQYTTGGTDEFV